jgi:quinol monooxygenase YgiN
MMVVVGSFRIAPSMVDVVLAPMEEMISASRAEEGCVEYAYAMDVQDKGLIRVSEVWRDREALEAHFRTSHIAEWRAQVSALAVSGRELTAYETKDEGFYI